MLDIKKYSDEVIAVINSLSDEAFDQLLEDAGLHQCPFSTSKHYAVKSFYYHESMGVYGKKNNGYSHPSPSCNSYCVSPLAA